MAKSFFANIACVLSKRVSTSRCLPNLFHVCGCFLQEYINSKDFERALLEIFAQVVSNYLCKVFIRDKYFGTAKKTDSNMK